MKRSPTANSKSILKLTTLGILSAIMLIMSFTPLGYLNIGPLAITFNVIPMAIAAVLLGPIGGGIIGAVFGVTSILQPLGIYLFTIAPIRTVIICFGSRVLAGVLAGLIFRLFTKIFRQKVTAIPCAVTGFCAALFNTFFFIGALLLFFVSNESIMATFTGASADVLAGQNVALLIISSIAVNALVEMAASAIVTSAVGGAVSRTSLFRRLGNK